MLIAGVGSKGQVVQKQLKSAGSKTRTLARASAWAS